MTSTPRRPRGRRPAQEPPATGSAAVDSEPDAESVARAIALQQLAAAPRTRQQLVDALARRGVPDDVAERVLDRFEEVRLVDDAEYAAMWVRSRHGTRGLARRALAHELRQRGVSGEDADEALDQVDDEQEAATARALVDRRLAATRRLDRDARVRRLAGLLARKGYPASLAFRVIREALEADGADLAGLEEPAE